MWLAHYIFFRGTFDMTDICNILSQFNPISLSSNSLTNEAITSGNLPDPALFFTWYCEKAREIEKHTGSVELSLQLLDLALENIKSNSRIAKRFILATKNSLIKYQIHINSLASKLNQENVPLEEKASILQTLRRIDLREFEKSARAAAVIIKNEDKNIPETNSEDSVSFEQISDDFSPTDWSIETEIIDLIIENRYNEAFSQAQQSLFFPTALLEKYSSDPLEWLEQYCKALLNECEVYLNNLKDDSIQLISAELCKDHWSFAINDHLKVSATKEQTICRILEKSKIALSTLKLSYKPINKVDDEFF